MKSQTVKNTDTQLGKIDGPNVRNGNNRAKFAVDRINAWDPLEE